LGLNENEYGVAIADYETSEPHEIALKSWEDKMNQLR